MNEAVSDEPADQSELTRDKFLGGRIIVAQPTKGFRAGLDSVLLAASVSGQTKSLLDLGAGVGTTSMCALADLPQVEATLAEQQEDLVEIASQNLADNEFAERSNVIRIDVSAAGVVRAAAGIRADHYTSVVANPPFFDEAAGTPARGTNRAKSRQMPAAELDKWVRAAATSVAPDGEVIFVHAIAALPDLLHSFTERFGAICIWPIEPRPNAESTRLLIRGIKGSRAPIRLLPAMVLHEKTGNQFAPKIDEIFRGKRRLDW